jgi:hypothetical protein
MAIDAIAYLVALSLPVWLVAEQLTSWRRSRKDASRVGAPVSTTSTARPRGFVPEPSGKAA